MNLYFRLLYVLFLHAIRRFSRSPNCTVDPKEESLLNLRVWPNDLDLNFHLNNGRFLTLMDLGRIDFVLRCGLGKKFLWEKWQPLIGSSVIRFRFSLTAFQKFTLRTRVIGWDEKWFYLEQRIERKNRTVAVAVHKALFRKGRRGNIPTVEVIKTLGIENPPLEFMPDVCRLHSQTETFL